MQSEVIEATGSDGVRLRVEFVWRGDRFGHLVSLIGEDSRTQPLLESLEGEGSEDWPASPPLQSLTVHTLPTGQAAALLVGMAGRSHWSASVEAMPEQAKLQFDIACRHSVRPKWLGSRYRIVDDTAKQLSLATEDARISYSAEIVTVEPGATNPNSPTTRWRYAVSIRLNPAP